MGIAKKQFDKILDEIFKTGNVIHLFSTMPNVSTEAGAVKISGSGYSSYTIKDGDFNVTSGSVESRNNMMFYLCETEGGHGSVVGFGVFNSNNEMLYFGEFTDSMPIRYNTVPTIKRYNSSNGEGIKVTMTSTEAAASAE